MVHQPLNEKLRAGKTIRFDNDLAGPIAVRSRHVPLSTDALS